MSLKDQIRRRRKAVDFFPDLSAALDVEDAERALNEAVKAAGDRLASKAARDAKKRLDEVKAAAGSTVLRLTLEALPRKRWAEIEEAHPPREGDETDKTFSLNWDAFLAEALPESVVEVVYRDSGEPYEVTPEEWREVVPEIGDAQYQALGLTVLNLNRAPVAPF